MKNINQQLFESVLEPMFPGEFITDVKYKEIYLFKGNGKYYNFSKNLDNAFWLAKKFSLFKRSYASDCVLFESLDGWKIHKIFGEKEEYFEAKTISEVICKAILEIYGKKDKE